MIKLDFDNVQEFVFSDQELRSKLPEYKHLFDSWLFSVRVPAMRQLGKRSVMDFLEQINEEQISVISEHLRDDVITDMLDYHIVKEIKIPIENIESTLNQVDVYANFSITRNEKEAKICFWR